MNNALLPAVAARVLRRCQKVACLPPLFFLAGSVCAATVGPPGYTNAFTEPPLAADWATFSRPGAPPDIYDSDADVNANITADAVTTQTTSVAADPPATSTLATWSSTGLYLQTRPKTIRYVALMGKFVNNTGTNATQVTISYLYTIAAGGTAEDSGKGTRVYYSTTGVTNSWANLASLNHIPTVNLSSTVRTNLALNWTNGASLYILWVDDNSKEVGDDAANQIDNFSLQVTAGTSAIVAPTVSLTSPAQAIRAAPGTNLTLTAAASVSSGSIVLVRFYDGLKLLGQSTNAPFSIDWNAPPAGIHAISARATSDVGLQAASAPVVVEVLSSNAAIGLFPDFSDAEDLSDLVLQGSAAFITNRLRLTPAVSNQVGGVWGNGEPLVQDGFETVFQFQISQPSGAGADGLAFVVLGSDSPTLGDPGGGLGYSSLTNSLAVEFDTYQNPEAADPDANHIGVHSRGPGRNSADETASLGRVTPSINMSDGAIHTVVIRYSPGMLRVFLDDLNLAALEVALDLGTLLNLDNGTAWVGLTSGTGGEFENHDLLMWSFRSNARPQVELTPLGPGPFMTPTNIVISANAFDLDGEITKLEFFANGSPIGDVGAPPFAIAWNNSAAGTYLLTAKATDDFGVAATSAPLALSLFEVPQLRRAMVENDGSVTFELATTSGQSYMVQYTADLIHWTNAVPSISGTGAFVRWRDARPPAAPAHYFYRVLVSPGATAPLKVKE